MTALEETPTSKGFQSPKVAKSQKSTYKKSNASESLESYIFPDIRALYEIGLEKFAGVEYTEVIIHGFEIYLVEQWAAERRLSTIITSYTGNSQDRIHAVQVVLFKNGEKWPGRFKEYYEDLSIFARPRIISKGCVFVTNLLTVSSKLNLLHVECGDMRAIWKNFEVNFDLKRLRCGGRSTLLLHETSTAAEDKFGQLYKIPIYSNERATQLKELEQNEHFLQLRKNYHPVVELVTIIQICLSYFNFYHCAKDGLLCDKTEAAVAYFWSKLAKYYFGVDRPKNEGVSGPVTVAALISLVLSCYCKLQVEACISSKDPFEENEFLTGVYNFQRKYGITRGSNPVYLDELTLQRLFETSGKTSNSDIFKFKNAVRSTVSDITRKSNPMQLSKEILTTDLDAMVRNVYGGSVGLLWRSKGRLRKSFCKDYGRFRETKFSRGHPQSLLQKQANEMKTDGSDSQGSTSSDDQAKHVFDNNMARYSTSNSSLSSMLCNCDKPISTATDFNLNRFYRGEYFRRNSLPFISDNTHDSMLEMKNKGEKGTDGLFRSNSLSTVQDVVECWSLPFDPSLVRMARDLLKINSQLQSREREQNLKCDYIPVDEVDYAGRNETFDMDFEHLISDLHDSYQIHNQRLKKLDANNREMESKQLLLHGEMRELTSLASKFKYDMGVLHLRMSDVQESISQFDRKLAAVQKLLVDQGLGRTLGKELLVDKEQLERCLTDFLQAENTKYEGVCSRMCSKKYVKHLYSDLKAWALWTFGMFFNKGAELRNGENNK